MNSSLAIPGIDLASELFKGVITKHVSLPVDTKRGGEDWYNLLRHRERKLQAYLDTASKQRFLPFENAQEQIKDHIQSELDEIAHLTLATSGYPFRLGNLSFLLDSKQQDGYLWPVFVPLDYNSAEFGIRVTRNSYGEGDSIQFSPSNLHKDIRSFYDRAVSNLAEISQRNRSQAAAISFTNKVSPPDWAREMIWRAVNSNLFTHVYILVDHSSLEWEITANSLPVDIAKMRELEEADRKLRQDKRYKDPMVIGRNTLSRTVGNYGQFSVSSWSVIALYDPSVHEQYVFDQFALSPKNF